MGSDIQKQAKAFEEALMPHDVFGKSNLKDEGRKLELVAGKLFYLARKEADTAKAEAISRSAKLILTAAETLKAL